MATLRKKKPATTAASELPTGGAPTPPKSDYRDFVPGHPKEDGPPAVANGAGNKLLSDETGSITVTFDNGSFRWLWEIVESNSLKHWNQYRNTEVAAPEAGRRALASVRRAGHHQYLPPPETMPKNHRPYPSPRYTESKPTTTAPPRRKLKKRAET